MHIPSLFTKYAYLDVSNQVHYAQTLIPLADYSNIDRHCKIYVQARRCVNLNFVTTLHISDSSLFMKIIKRSIAKKSTFNINYETCNFFFGKSANQICMADFDHLKFSVVAHWIFEKLWPRHIALWLIFNCAQILHL